MGQAPLHGYLRTHRLDLKFGMEVEQGRVQEGCAPTLLLLTHDQLAVLRLVGGSEWVGFLGGGGGAVMEMTSYEAV